MQWSDIRKPAPLSMLRQFAGLCLAIFGGLGAWRAFQHGWDTWTWVWVTLAAGLGVVGLLAPRVIAPVYAGWMVAVFPIGWVVSRLMLAGLFFLIFTPVALVFRLMGRDVMHRRRPDTPTYWTPKVGASDVKQYLRQF